MAILSMRTRKKAWDIALAVLVIGSAWVLQLTVLNNLTFQDVMCNLPLTITILFGFVFESQLPPISADQLRTRSAGEIFLRQTLSGSMTGLLAGAFFASLYASVLPVYPIALPIIGWVAGYFSPRKLNQETLMCIPVVLLGTVLAELVMAQQLYLIGRTEAFMHLAHLALPEALLNSLIAPFVYFPMRRFHDFADATEVPET